MIVRNIKEFKKLTYQKKIICFDYGKKKIGVAISDENNKISIPMSIIFKNKKFKKEMIKNIPLGRVAEESDVATAVAFLAGDSSAMITGTSLVVDGGWTAQ